MKQLIYNKIPFGISDIMDSYTQIKWEIIYIYNEPLAEQYEDNFFNHNLDCSNGAVKLAKVDSQI